MTKTYGSIIHKTKTETIKGKEIVKELWSIESAQPHVCIKLKALFPQIRKSSVPPFEFPATDEHAHNLLWFMERYPMEVSDEHMKMLNNGKKQRIDTINDLESILLPDYHPKTVELTEGNAARDYQLKGHEFHLKVKRFLLGDAIGLGKTLTAILSFLKQEHRPVAVVVQAHLPKQWHDEIKRFTGLNVHIVKTRKAYNLPPADIYIFKYTSLSGWVDLFGSGFFKNVVFDECQELRHQGTNKYEAATILAENAEMCVGCSASPVYNYGDEIFNVLNVIKPHCLGTAEAFNREWCEGYGNRIRVTDPIALGTYLRESMLLLRRTRADVGRELPPVNKIVYTVESDDELMDKDIDLARQLAIKVMHGSFVERGQASLSLDALIRHATGVAKAKSVAAYLKIILESGIKLVVGLWHRTVFDILMEELQEYNPVMYSGSESITEKEKSKQAFIAGNAQVFLLSLRSGIGLDGLQKVCSYVAFAELDYSPAVMNQVIGRVDRDNGGFEEQVTAIYLVSNSGSDPLMIDILGLKASQQHGIINPLTSVPQQYSNESRVKLLAQQYLDKK